MMPLMDTYRSIETLFSINVAMHCGFVEVLKDYSYFWLPRLTFTLVRL